jgi:cytochrome c
LAAENMPLFPLFPLFPPFPLPALARTRKDPMKKFALIAAIATVAAGPALANPDLATKKNCMACHALDKKLVGPSYKDVAAKYAKDNTAAAKLAEKIQKGGQGVWGPVPMPANPQVSAEEAKTLAAWVLSAK